MGTVHYNSCPVCGSEQLKFVFKSADHTASGKSFSIYQCDECTLRFTQDVPDMQAIAAYYRSPDYISHAEDSKGLINWLYRKVRVRNTKKKQKLLDKLAGGATGTVLDIGAGIGTFLKKMKDSGWKAEGLEPSPEARAIAKRKYELDLGEDIKLFSLPHSGYDVITMWHVLEHVHDLHGYIRQIKTLLKQDGKLIVAVPNYKSLDADIYKEYWAAYDVPRHLYHFSPVSMKILMEKHGLEIRQYRPMWFDSFYVALLSTKYKSGTTRYIPGVFAGLRSNLKAVGNARKCSSLIYIISK